MKIIEQDLEGLKRIIEEIIDLFGCKLDMRIVKRGNDSWSINIDSRTVIVIDNESQNITVSSPIASLNNKEVMEAIENSILSKVKQRLRNEKINDLLSN